MSGSRLTSHPVRWLLWHITLSWMEESLVMDRCRFSVEQRQVSDIGALLPWMNCLLILQSYLLGSRQR